MDLHSRIAHISLHHFQTLPKSGKPNANEWTVLSTIVQNINNQLSVVALATGSKCIGASFRSSHGDILNDSHAEVLCRRALLRYFYKEMLAEQSAIFQFSDNKFVLAKNVTFHFFTTQVPCGDAAIFPKNEDVDDDSEPVKKKSKITLLDIHRTGAKCVADAPIKDTHGSGVDYHVTGVVRTKPGRGDPTASVSCSDKIAKWCHMGVQGALLNQFLKEPIYLSSFTINSQFCEASLKHAFYDRLNNPNLLHPYKRHLLDIQQVDVHFDYAKCDTKNPCASSIIYSNLEKGKQVEVSVDGYKQGTTKKRKGAPSSRLSVCQLELFKLFLEMARARKLNVSDSYHNCKKLDALYVNCWTLLKNAFGSWPSKNSDMYNFAIKDL